MVSLRSARRVVSCVNLTQRGARDVLRLRLPRRLQLDNLATYAYDTFPS
jgi:hypothetical protein